MPTYDYKCNACKHEFEAFQSIKASALRKCPQCGKNALERLIGTGGAVIFKGSGFYQTDYRSESYKKAAEKDKPAEATTDSKSAESKAADGPTKPEPKAPAPEAKPAPKPKPDKKAKSKA